MSESSSLSPLPSTVHQSDHTNEEGIDEYVPGPHTGGSHRIFRLRNWRDVEKAWSVPIRVANRWFDPKWEQLLGRLTFQFLDGMGEDRYIRWYPHGGFFHIAGARPALLNLLVEYDLDAKVNPLYVEASEGGPWGAYILDVLKDYRRAGAIFVQRYGEINAVPCECCERRYKQSDGYDHTMAPETDDATGNH